MPTNFHPFLLERERKWTEGGKSKGKQLVDWSQKVGVRPREYIERSNSILQGGPRVSLSRVAGCLDYMFVLPGFRDKFPSLTSRDAGAILRGNWQDAITPTSTFSMPCPVIHSHGKL